MTFKKNYTIVSKYCNLWRNSGDIDSKWTTVEDIIDYYTTRQDELIAATVPGHWNDPDVARVQMCLWSIWSAPLITSSDLRVIDKESKEILLNKRVIDIDQDPMGQDGPNGARCKW
ncbi:alpha-galactosidase/alpha-n-acetylgalactosaminidase [Aphelenchoides avenae]|nr:alpha-galactosidase/alpha-n-acetylgalactosaminidase [Aphelenchus avenae]